MMAHLTPEQEAIKACFIRERGYWRPWTEVILAQHPQFLQAYANYAGYPARTGSLSARMVELVYVALDASSTHLYGPGLKTHLAKAFEAGASPADILGVLHCVAVQGLSSVYQGLNILAEEAGLDSVPADAAWPDGLAAHLATLPVDLCEQLRVVGRFDPGYVRVVLEFIALDTPGAGLSPYERHLIHIALHACFTGFNPDALRTEIRTTLQEGGAVADIVQVIQLGAHLSVHGTALGAAALSDHSGLPMGTGTAGVPPG